MSFSFFTNLIEALQIRNTVNGHPINRWTNADILPVLSENRSYTLKSYLGFGTNLISTHEQYPSVYILINSV